MSNFETDTEIHLSSQGLKTPIPITEGLDPLTMMVDDAIVATWNNQGLPSDRMSTENATILTSAERLDVLDSSVTSISCPTDFTCWCRGFRLCGEHSGPLSC